MPPYHVFSCVFIFFLHCTAASKLNVPRVLLPLFSESIATNYTLEVSDNGCYRWTLSRLDVVRLIPVNMNRALGCSSKVVLQTITKELTRNTAIVMVEEQSSGEMLRCDVIVDVISSLSVVTTTRQLFIEEAPEIFEVRAYDNQGNEFTTLEGIEFAWKISSSDRSDHSASSDVLRFINFKDSLYEIPPTVAALEEAGSKGHIVLLEGVKTGTAIVSVKLIQQEYANVPATTVQLSVIANLIIEPADAYILKGDIISYKLLQVKNGKLLQLSLPSSQYYLYVKDGGIVKELQPWMMEGLREGRTRMILRDKYNAADDLEAAYLPSVTLTVAPPAYMNLALFPHRNWLTVQKKINAVAAELFEKNGHKIYMGPLTVVEIRVDERFFVLNSAKNGTYVVGYAREAGIIPVQAVLKSLVTTDGSIVSLPALTARADMIVFENLKIIPSEVYLPWDDSALVKSSARLRCSGGDDLNQWSVENAVVAQITQSGVLKAKAPGWTEVAVAMQKNPAIRGLARVVVAIPSSLQILRHSGQARVGSPIFIAIALFAESKEAGTKRNVLFTDCSDFPFVVVPENGFAVHAKFHAKTLPGSCATIAVVGSRFGSGKIRVRYGSLEASCMVNSYEGWQVSNPKGEESLLALGASRNVAFSGGPGRSRIKHESNLMVVEISPGSVYRVTCLREGEGELALTNENAAAFPESEVEEAKVKISCGHPQSVELHRGLEGCTGNTAAAKDAPVVVGVTVKDSGGGIFDNATTLRVDWKLSNVSGEVRFPGILVLKEEDEGGFAFPAGHFQMLMAHGEGLELSATVIGYNRQWLKKVGALGSDNDVGGKASISLALVDALKVEPTSLAVFNHPDNKAVFRVLHGSGFYKITPTSDDVADIRYVEAGRYIEATPLKPGFLRIMISDECLKSDPISVEVTVLTIGKLEVSLRDKIQLGKSSTATIQLFDSNGKIAAVNPTLLRLYAIADSNILETSCQEETMSCHVKGALVGFANLDFSLKSGSQSVRGPTIRVQIYPPLELHPSNITLIPGATYQITHKGGPVGDCTLEYSSDNGRRVTIDERGILKGGWDLGAVTVIGKSVGADSGTGKRVVYSQAAVEASVARLQGFRLKSPVARLQSGTVMPIWVEGLTPHPLNPLVLGSAEPPVMFQWHSSAPAVAQVMGIFQHKGIKISDEDKISMRISALKSGQAVVTVTGTLSNSPKDEKVTFSDTLTVEVFDPLELTSSKATLQMLLSYDTQYHLKTNKDNLAKMSYKIVEYENTKTGTVLDVQRSSSLSVDKNGILYTYGVAGSNLVVISSQEDDGSLHSTSINVRVKPVKYTMVNVKLPINAEVDGGISTLPVGGTAQFFLSYHDDEGVKFAGAKTLLKLQSNRIDRAQISPSESGGIFGVDLVEEGVTLIKIFDKDTQIIPDYVKINATHFIQPHKARLIVGDVVCYTLPKIVLENGGNSSSCKWTSSDSSLVLDGETGIGTARSKQNDVVISYRCPNKILSTTSADIHPLTKIELLLPPSVNVTNNGEEFMIPLLLSNDALGWSHRQRSNLVPDVGSFACDVSLADVRHFPYHCRVKLMSAPFSTVFQAIPKFDAETGLYACLIKSSENKNIMGETTTYLLESNLELKVTWGEDKSVTSVFPYHPAVFADKKSLVVTDTDTTDSFTLTGLARILLQISVTTTDEKCISLRKERSESEECRAKYIVYLRSSYFKEHCQKKSDWKVIISSPLTNQKISIPILVDVHAGQYIPPKYFGQYLEDFYEDYISWKALMTLVVAVSIYLIGVKIYENWSQTHTIANVFPNVTLLDRSHHSPIHNNSSRTPSPFARKSDLNEVQLMYTTEPFHVRRPSSRFFPK